MDFFEYMSNPHRQCAIVAHRGIWSDAPENSLLSIRRAIEAGYDVRTTGVDGDPEHMTLAELTSLTLRDRDGGPNNNTATGEKLPSLRDVFGLTRDRIFVHLDIKYRHVIPEVLAYARKMGVEKQVDFWADLKTEADLAWIRENITSHNVPFIARTHLEHDNWREQLWVNTLDSVASPGFTDSAALKDPDAVWGRLLGAGFSAIQTDEMAALRAYIETHNPEAARKAGAAV
ncbi:glycerophosphoryl diester phosphodiesterase [Diaporthe sp. PMI_573]|nr:glycerophosphoryl diester phosphodiesterase [Diaporthaceae sp. PMI_573]